MMRPMAREFAEYERQAEELSFGGRLAARPLLRDAEAAWLRSCQSEAAYGRPQNVNCMMWNSGYDE